MHPPVSPEFASPPARFRGAPFWSWNCRLDPAQLLRQIDALRVMGMGGFHLHVRTGLADPYLGPDYFAAVRACVDKAQQDGLLAYLYDEDRWPSGFAGGLVTREPGFRSRHLLWTAAHPPAEGRLLRRYEISLDRGGCLARFRRLNSGEEAAPGCRVWSAYLQLTTPSSWFNGQTYVDALNPAAIDRFIEITHEAYRREVGDRFGTVIPSIFTDEPQVASKKAFSAPDAAEDLTIPFTDDFFESYATAYGERLEDHLPELFWDLPGRVVSPARYRYHDHVAERFASSFGDRLSSWCGRHRLELTGHMLYEATLSSQTAGIGEVMRAMRSFQVPGLDMLCDRREYTTAKQAQSLARQYGRSGVTSELYGVTNWDFDFVGHKGQGDWQAALGVTRRVPHLAWVSMAGEAKRDWPGPIGPQATWWREYPLIEDHFARLNTVLTRGRPICRVGMIHPIESAWLCFGPASQNGAEQRERDDRFLQATAWLLHGLIDFDYLSESLLPGLLHDDGTSHLKVGNGTYEAVVVPSLKTMRRTTAEALEAFADRGGTVIFAGEIPSLIDALPSDRAARLASRCCRIEFSREVLLAALESWRDLSAHSGDGASLDSLLYQLREEDGDRHLFLCNTDRARPRPGTRVALRGRWKATRLDTLDGTAAPLGAIHENGITAFFWNFEGCESLLLKLEPDAPVPPSAQMPSAWTLHEEFARPVEITLSEPNVLLLDIAEWRINDIPWEPKEEILRLDNSVRHRLNLPPRGGHIVQPWADKTPSPTLATVHLRFHLDAALPIAAPLLAMEEPHRSMIMLDGLPVPSHDTGWWVDEAIRTVPLPSLESGRHELTISIPFGRKTDLERFYLLGDFGVEVIGHCCRLIAPVTHLVFGDWVSQGLPFYAGNVTYHLHVPGAGVPLAVETPRFRAPLLTAALDGEPIGPIAFPPFRLHLGSPKTGEHRLDITAFGSRHNAFAAIHNSDPDLFRHNPESYRSEGKDWSYDYQLKPAGILLPPRVFAQR